MAGSRAARGQDPKGSYRRTEFARFNRKEGIDWPSVLDFIRERCGFIEDKQLASHLDIPPSTLSSVRHGKAELSMMAKYNLLDRFGFHLISEATEILAADELAIKARRASRRAGALRSPGDANAKRPN